MLTERLMVAQKGPRLGAIHVPHVYTNNPTPRALLHVAVIDGREACFSATFQPLFSPTHILFLYILRCFLFLPLLLLQTGLRHAFTSSSLS
jgi:hypothetical protein